MAVHGLRTVDVSMATLKGTIVSESAVSNDQFVVARVERAALQTTEADFGRRNWTRLGTEDYQTLVEFPSMSM